MTLFQINKVIDEAWESRKKNHYFPKFKVLENFNQKEKILLFEIASTQFGEHSFVEFILKNITLIEDLAHCNFQEIFSKLIAKNHILGILNLLYFTYEYLQIDFYSKFSLAIENCKTPFPKGAQILYESQYTPSSDLKLYLKTQKIDNPNLIIKILKSTHQNLISEGAKSVTKTPQWL